MPSFYSPFFSFHSLLFRFSLTYHPVLHLLTHPTASYSAFTHLFPHSPSILIPTPSTLGKTALHNLPHAATSVHTTLHFTTCTYYQIVKFVLFSNIGDTFETGRQNYNNAIKDCNSHHGNMRYMRIEGIEEVNIICVVQMGSILTQNTGRINKYIASARNAIFECVAWIQKAEY